MYWEFVIGKFVVLKHTGSIWLVNMWFLDVDFADDRLLPDVGLPSRDVYNGSLLFYSARCKTQDSIHHIQGQCYLYRHFYYHPILRG